MARTTRQELQVILPEGSGLSDPQLDAAIMASSCLVDQVASSCGSGLSDDCLKQIEMYAAAHFAAATEIALSRTSEVDSCGGSATYGFKVGEGIKGTPFGIMANTLSGGCLAEFDKQPVNLFSIGCI